MRAGTPGLALLAGSLAAVLHFAGALKSAPALSALPFDITVVAAAGLLGALALLAIDRDWRADRRLAVPLMGCGGLWLWMAIAGAWSPSGEILAAKLPDAVLVAPAMLMAGMAVAGDGATLRRCADAVLAIGVFVAASIAWGLAADRVVLGGLPGANPEQVRVQYQIAGLAIASAGALAAVRSAEAMRMRARVGWLLVVAALSGSALLPGGRAALIALAIALALAPAILLWRTGRRMVAFLWPLAVGLGMAALVAAILSDPPLASGLRTVERLAEGEVAQASGRLSLWRVAREEGGAALPFGLGTGGFTIAAGFGERRGMYPHNHLLEALAEGGLPGLVLWLLAFGGGAVAALALGARVAAWRAARVAALVLPMALTVMVSTDLGNRMAWFALGLALGLGISSAPRHVSAVRQARA